jgi:gamma-glutamyl:cysteine ligase YbdK (ATP-grasp superfamily)
MAEAVAAVGVAAAAVQFFEFSLKTLTLCKQIHDSEKSATEANHELETSIGKLKQITEDLQLNVVLQAVDRPITTARQDCVAAIGDLEKLLDDVKPKSRKHSFAAARSALRAIRSKPKIEALQNKISEAQRRFLAAASVETPNDVARLLQEQGRTSDKMLQALLQRALGHQYQLNCRSQNDAWSII